MSAGAVVDTANLSGSTALMHACEAGRDAVASLLIQRGASVDVVSEGGITALMLASSGGHGPATDLLIASGAGVDVQDVKGNTAIVHAATSGASNAFSDGSQAHEWEHEVSTSLCGKRVGW